MRSHHNAVTSSFEQLIEITHGYAAARTAADKALCDSVRGGFVGAAKEAIDEFFDAVDPEEADPGVVFAAHASLKMIAQVEHMVEVLESDD